MAVGALPKNQKPVPELLAEELGWTNVEPDKPPNFADAAVLQHVRRAVAAWAGGEDGSGAVEPVDGSQAPSDEKLLRAFELLRDYKRRDGEPFGPLFRALEVYACAHATRDIALLPHYYFSGRGSSCKYDGSYYATLQQASRAFRVQMAREGGPSPELCGSHEAVRALLKGTVEAALLLYVNDRVATQNESKVEVPGTMLQTWQDTIGARLQDVPCAFRDSNDTHDANVYSSLRNNSVCVYAEGNQRRTNQLAGWFQHLEAQQPGLGDLLAPPLDVLLLRRALPRLHASLDAKVDRDAFEVAMRALEDRLPPTKTAPPPAPAAGEAVGIIKREPPTPPTPSPAFRINLSSVFASDDEEELLPYEDVPEGAKKTNAADGARPRWLRQKKKSLLGISKRQKKTRRSSPLLLPRTENAAGIKKKHDDAAPASSSEPLRARAERIAAALRHLRAEAPAVQAFRDYNREHRDGLFEALGASAKEAFEAWAQVDDPRRLPALAEAERWGQTFHELLAGHGAAHRGAVSAALALVRRVVEECGR